MSGVIVDRINNKTVLFKLTNGSLNVTIKQGDLSKEICDAIVNPTQTSMHANGGLDTIIHQTMGPFFTQQVESLSKELKTDACPVGQSRIFVAKAERDPNVARFVINTVGPNYVKEGKDLASFHLKSCYCTSLSLANTYGLSSIAYPAISCGAYYFPPNEAAQVGIEAIRENSYQVKDIRFVLFDEKIYRAFVEEWTNYADKVNREANVIDDRERPRTAEPPTILNSRPSTRFCNLCKERQLSNDQDFLCNQCSNSSRAETFMKFLEKLRIAAEKSFDDLKKECQALKKVLSVYPLRYTPVLKFDQSIHKRDPVAESYLQSHCDRQFRQAMPMDVLGDGNCFYNTFVRLSGIGGTTDASLTPVELRARNVIELVLNVEHYRRKYEAVQIILDDFEKYVTKEMVNDTNYAAVWDFFSISTVLNIKVVSVYPKVNGTSDINYATLNGKHFEPLPNEDTVNGNQLTTVPEVKILFSHCNKFNSFSGQDKSWVPNHFVPLLSLR